MRKLPHKRTMTNKNLRGKEPKGRQVTSNTSWTGNRIPEESREALHSLALNPAPLPLKRGFSLLLSKIILLHL